MSLKIEDFRCSSSSIDDFFSSPKSLRTAAMAVTGKIRIASLRDLTGFFRTSADTLVHLSQQDFWHIGKDNEGYFIERLVDDSEGPVKD
jgi:hypothetical protein